MKERLQQILNYLGYSATRFADEIEVQRSGISHILSGRNQPSYDFLVKLLGRFPQLDAEWLILGKGSMLKNEKPQTETTIQPKNQLLITEKEKIGNLFSAQNKTLLEKQPQESNGNNSVKVTCVTIVDRIIVLNSDGTFDIYQQAKKD
jgi:transcriptional regulator with XRE-family HTH domain